MKSPKRYVEQLFLNGFQTKVETYPRESGLFPAEKPRHFLLKKLPPFYVYVSMDLCCYSQSLPREIVTCAVIFSPIERTLVAAGHLPSKICEVY